MYFLPVTSQIPAGSQWHVSCKVPHWRKVTISCFLPHSVDSIKGRTCYGKAIRVGSVEIFVHRGYVPTGSGADQEDGDPRIAASHRVSDRYRDPGARRRETRRLRRQYSPVTSQDPDAGDVAAPRPLDSRNGIADQIPVRLLLPAHAQQMGTGYFEQTRQPKGEDHEIRYEGPGGRDAASTEG